MKLESALTTSATSDQRRTKRRAWRKLLPYAIGVGLLVAIVAGLWPQPLRVETAPVTRGPLTVSVLEEGKTRIRHRYAISAPVSGFLKRVELRPGAPIHAGKTVLATIDAGPSGFLDPRARAEAEARVHAAEATQMSRQAEVERATATLDLAQKDLARAAGLHKMGLISKQEWDTTENRVQVLTRELRGAEFAFRRAAFEVAQAQAALLQARAPDPAKSEPLQLTAPVDGYVLNVFEEQARVVTAGVLIMEVGDPRDLEAEIELLSRDAVGVTPGAEVSIEQWGGDAPLRGRVSVVERGGFTKVSALGVEEQRVKVRVDFLDPLPPGRELGDRYRVEARIVTWHGDNMLQVPTGALFRHGGAWVTFVVQNSKARQRKVDIGHNNGITAEVRSGLTEGETVILYPSETISDAVSVSVKPSLR
jgi:HlyD family secretion protein